MSPRAHPEFGYFCLSQSFRRKAQKALLSTVAIGVVAGGFVLWARDDPHEGAPTIVSINEAPAGAETMSTVVRATSATTAERLDQPASSKATCDGDNWSQVDGECAVRRTHKPGSLASATEGLKIAAVPANPSTPPFPVAVPPAPSAAMRQSPQRRRSRRQPRQSDSRLPLSKRGDGRHAARLLAAARIERVPGHAAPNRGEINGAPASTRHLKTALDRPGPKPAIKWARQLQDCIGAVRCRAGEQLLRTFLSGGI